MSLSTFFMNPVEWLYSNLFDIVFSVMVLAIIYGVYKFSTGQISRLKKEERLDENVAFILNRIFRWGLLIVAAVFVVSQLGIKIDLMAGFLVLAGGTVIGFAAMNTVGNAIAGIIIMVSRPFKVGDRVCFEDQFSDVEDIGLIYTRMKTTDNVLISIPNQKLLQNEIENYGKGTIVRRRHSITAGYEEPTEKVENALLEAADNVEGVLSKPKPHVWVTELQNYAVEYTLSVYIKNIKQIQRIDSDVRKAIYTTCKQKEIDLSTPNLIRSIR